MKELKLVNRFYVIVMVLSVFVPFTLNCEETKIWQILECSEVRQYDGKLGHVHVLFDKNNKHEKYRLDDFLLLSIRYLDGIDTIELKAKPFYDGIQIVWDLYEDNKPNYKLLDRIYSYYLPISTDLIREAKNRRIRLVIGNPFAVHPKSPNPEDDETITVTY